MIASVAHGKSRPYRKSVIDHRSGPPACQVGGLSGSVGRTSAFLARRSTPILPFVALAFPPFQQLGESAFRSKLTCPYQKFRLSREKLLGHGGKQFKSSCVRYSLTQTRRRLVAAL